MNSPLYLDMELVVAREQGRHVQLAAAGFRQWGSVRMCTGFQCMAERDKNIVMSGLGNSCIPTGNWYALNIPTGHKTQEKN